LTEALSQYRQKDGDPFDPDKDPSLKPYEIMVDQDLLGPKLDAFDSSHTEVTAPRTATIATVEAALKLLERTFYGQVAEQLQKAGDPIELAGRRLTGSKLLWRSMIAMGLPLSIERNAFLRSLIFGRDSILSGIDPEGDGDVLDNLHAIYTYYSTRKEDPPASNIIGRIQAVTDTRRKQLLDTLIDIVKDIQASGESEPPELFAPTLLRLSLQQ
jgi:hypothetical protein